MPVVIRRATRADALTIARLHQASFITAHTGLIAQRSLDGLTLEGFEARWKKRLLERKVHVYVAEQQQCIVGFVWFTACLRIHMAEVMLLYVDPLFFRQGIGKQLMRFTLHYLREHRVTLIHGWALKNNPQSRAFYETLGARTDGTERVVHKPVRSTQVEYYRVLKAFAPRNRGSVHA